MKKETQRLQNRLEVNLDLDPGQVFMIKHFDLLLNLT